MKKVISLLISIVLAMSLLTGCGDNQPSSMPVVSVSKAENTSASVVTETSASTENKTQDAVKKSNIEIYENVLNLMFETIVTEQGDLAEAFMCDDTVVNSIYMKDGTFALIDAQLYISSAEELATTGYAFVDFNGDGRDELVIGEYRPYHKLMQEGSTIYSVWSYGEDEEPVCLMSGDGLSGVYKIIYHGNGEFLQSRVIPNGTYSYNGYEAVEEYFVAKLKENEPELEYVNYYFSLYDTNGFYETYKNDTGVIDVNASEYVGRTLGMPTEVSDLYWEGDFISYEYFDSYEYTGALATAKYYDKKNPANSVFLHGAYDVDLLYIDYVELESDTDFLRMYMVPAYELKDFTLLKLEFESIDDAGNCKFSTTKLDYRESLEKFVPVVFGASFGDTMPFYGFSYVDESGDTKYVAFSESGKDGSFYCTEFTPAD